MPIEPSSRKSRRSNAGASRPSKKLIEDTMSHSAAAALIFAVIAVFSAERASAGPCGEEVAVFRASLPQNPTEAAGDVGSAPQSVGAQLRHQPTPASIARAERSALSKVVRMLSRADAFDAAGDQRACRHALSKARLLVNP
jgi:hypothetical protein